MREMCLRMRRQFRFAINRYLKQTPRVPELQLTQLLLMFFAWEIRLLGPNRRLMS